jgi:hypothetical protein
MEFSVQPLCKDARMCNRCASLLLVALLQGCSLLEPAPCVVDDKVQRYIDQSATRPDAATGKWNADEVARCLPGGHVLMSMKVRFPASTVPAFIVGQRLQELGAYRNSDGMLIDAKGTILFAREEHDPPTITMDQCLRVIEAILTRQEKDIVQVQKLRISMAKQKGTGEQLDPPIDLSSN